MDGEGCRIQIALEVKASFLDEAFVFRIVRDRKQELSAVCLAGPDKVAIHEGVSAGQKPRRFRRSVFSQLDSQRHRRSHNYET
jgi:hypothetical protein